MNIILFILIVAVGFWTFRAIYPKPLAVYNLDPPQEKTSSCPDSSLVFNNAYNQKHGGSVPEFSHPLVIDDEAHMEVYTDFFKTKMVPQFREELFTEKPNAIEFFEKERLKQINNF